MRRLVIIGVASALGLTSAWGSGSANAGARAVGLACGATITVDTVLTSDLIDCPDDGLVVGANGVTLDLNGHTISGDGLLATSCAPDAVCDVGVSDVVPHRGVTIKGGRVQGFDVGVLVVGGVGDRLQRMNTMHNSSFGAVERNMTRSQVVHSSSSDDGTSGILVLDSTDMRLDHDSVNGSHGYGMPLFRLVNSRVEENVLDRNDHGILLQSSRGSTVRRNRISHSGGSSLDVGQSQFNRLVNNVITDNGDGVILTESQDNEVSGNVITRTGMYGFPDTGGFGVILDGAADNVLHDNVVVGGRGPAIFVTSLDAADTSDRNTVARNVANSASDSGIVVSNGASGNVITHNTANGSGDDGIHVDSLGNAVSRNTADDNHDLGIEAVDGTVDRGGNHADGNGNPAQCVGVRCR
jgi:parallel beta-helix repeat protein